MPLIEIAPHAGINKRFPVHKIAKGKTQKVRELLNILSLDGKFKIIGGTERYNTSSVGESGSFARWAKRIYTIRNDERFRNQFAIIGNKFYKGHDTDKTLNHVPINSSFDEEIESTGFPRSTTMKVSSVVNTYVVDGKRFYYYDGNELGNWQVANTSPDIDGNTIEPVDCMEYLDRLFVITKNRNHILVSANLAPDSFNDGVDSALLEVPPGNGGFPTGFVKIRGFLYLVHEDYFAPITGFTASTFAIQPGDIIWGFGSKARRSIINFGPNAFAFVNTSDNEIYVSGGTADSTQLLSYEIEFSKLINPNKVQDTTAVYHKNLLRFSYVKNGEVDLGKEIIYSENEKKWCGETEGINISCYTPWDGEGDKAELVTGRSDTGALVYHDRTLNFDGTAIHYKFDAGYHRINPKDPVSDNRIEYFYLEGVPGGDYTVPLTYYIDGRITTYGQEAINMQGEGIHLGLIRIADQDVFLNKVYPKYDRSRGRLIRFLIEETELNRTFEFYSIFAKYNTSNRIYDKNLVGQ
jgi:hypothetical protein